MKRSRIDWVMAIYVNLTSTITNLLISIDAAVNGIEALLISIDAAVNGIEADLTSMPRGGLGELGVSIMSSDIQVPVTLEDSTPTSEEMYDTAVNAADQTIVHDISGWKTISFDGWCHDNTGANRANALFLIEYSYNEVNWWVYYRSVGVEAEASMTWEHAAPHWRATAGDLLGAGTGVAGDLIDLAIGAKV